MPKQHPITIDLLHPTVVRAFTNWGYICFFGAMAALITLLFFAISQVKQADEVRQQAQRQAASSLASSDQESIPAVVELVPAAAEEVVSESQRVEKPFVYRNDTLGFSVNYGPLIQNAGLLESKTLTTATHHSRNGATSVTIFNSTDASFEGGSPWPIFSISWVKDGRSIRQYEADERARFINDYGSSTAAQIGVNRQIVNGVDVLVVSGEPGLCDTETYTVFNRGYRIGFGSTCGNRGAALDATLRSLQIVE